MSQCLVILSSAAKKGDLVLVTSGFHDRETQTKYLSQPEVTEAHVAFVELQGWTKHGMRCLVIDDSQHYKRKP